DGIRAATVTGVQTCALPIFIRLFNWVAKQVLDIGVYGIIWPHVDTVEEAYNAVAAMRYPRVEGRPLREPFGRRGDAPNRAVTYRSEERRVGKARRRPGRSAG